jgi:glycosyltransferase involved in cell wall biosynthesis
MSRIRVYLRSVPRTIRGALKQAIAYKRTYGLRQSLDLALKPSVWLPAVLRSLRRATRQMPAVPGASDSPIWAVLDRPAEGATVDGVVCFIQGWALCRQAPLDRVEIYVNERLAGRARLGLPSPTVAAISAIPAAGISGFEFVASPAEFAGEGNVAIRAVVVDAERRLLEIPSRRFSVNRWNKTSPVLPRQSAIAEKVAATKTVGDPLRLAVFAHDLGYGGAQLYLTDLIQQMLIRRPIDISLFSPANGPLARRMQELGVEVIIRPNPPFESQPRYEQRVEWLRAWLIEHRIDAVIGNTLLAFAPVTAAAVAGVPALWAIHESYPLPLWCALNGAVTGETVHTMTGRMECAIRRASAVIFEAEATRKIFLQYGDPSRMFKVAYGIDTGAIDAFLARFDREQIRRSLGYSSTDRLVLSVGTFEPRKQQTALAQAFAEVAARHPSARLALVGRSHMHEQYVHALDGFIERTGMNDRIRVLPVKARIFDWYCAADLFALASDVESMPRTYLESMGFGVPVLAGNAYGVPELIEDEVTGYLVEPNGLKDLTAKLDQLLSLDGDALYETGARARKLVQERYNAAGYATEFLRLIDQLR